MKTNNAYQGRAVYIVDGARAPFLKVRNAPGPFSASDLAVATCAPLLNRQPFSPEAIDEVITGCVMPSPDEANISRVIALRLGCGKQVPAWTVQRNCGTGLQAIDNAAQDIANDRADIVLAGGVEAMSHAPILYNQLFVRWLSQWMQTKKISRRMGLLTQLRPQFLIPVFALLRGLTDPVVGMSMGQTAEQLAYRFHISRTEMDAFALQSHMRLAAAQDAKQLSEILTIYDNEEHYFDHDDGLRRDTTMEALEKLKPFFDKKYGAVTAGNSSQITDGAAFMILASENAVAQYNLPVLAEIVDVEWAALDPREMGLGPVFASTPLLLRNQLTLRDIDYWEINEAFAAQVLACLKAWENDDFCRENFGLSGALGSIPSQQLNIYGGAIAIGHPIGASGARIILQLANALARNQRKLGIATLCIGGGQGGAMLLKGAA